ncbi:MAG TPA: hypothetical protein VGH28_12480 [Polyangiaceae bacterium]
MRLGTLALAVAPHVVAGLVLAADVHAPPVARAQPEAPRVVRREAAPARRVAATHQVPARVLTFRLEHGESVPGERPNTWVHVPAGVANDLKLTFVFHGFKNCIASYTSAGASCRKRDPEKRPGYAIAEQLEREGSTSIVVVPETSFDVESAEAPALAMHGAFRAYVSELLEALADETGGKTLADVKRLALVASSGGYQALEPILADSESMVSDVILLDAGYMYPNSTVGHFLGVVLGELASGAPEHRLGILYTPSGGALPTSFALREIAERAAGERGSFAHFRDDPPIDALRSPLYVHRVDEDHDVVVRRNLGRAIAAAGL